MGFQLSPASIRILQNVHPDIRSIVVKAAALSEVEFIVTEGMRTVERQRLLFAKGASKTMQSRHLTGHAVDLAAKIGGEVRWDWPLYHKLAFAMKSAAVQLGLPLEWGGDWRNFQDGPHFQLPVKEYPA